MFYKVILEYGHLGAGRGFEVTRFLKADGPLHAFDMVRGLPRVKKKKRLLGLKLLKEVTEAEYMKGLGLFREFCNSSPYFGIRRRKGGEGGRL